MKYTIPNELLGGQTKAIELTQTGAIDFTVAGTPNLEIFADVYEVFSMPYLFTSEEAYFAAMNDTDYMNQVLCIHGRYRPAGSDMVQRRNQELLCEKTNLHTK